MHEHIARLNSRIDRMAERSAEAIVKHVRAGGGSDDDCVAALIDAGLVEEPKLSDAIIKAFDRAPARVGMASVLQEADQLIAKGKGGKAPLGSMGNNRANGLQKLRERAERDEDVTKAVADSQGALADKIASTLGVARTTVEAVAKARTHQEKGVYLTNDQMTERIRKAAEVAKNKDD